MSQPVTTAHNAKRMYRFELMQRLTGLLRNEEAVIGGIGHTNFDLWSAGHRPQNFYMLGSMGLAVPIALGVALAQPRRKVFALEGDGSLLMQLGCLSTVATLAPKNLAILVMDNGVYQITGGQSTPAAGGTDYVAIARGCGLSNAAWAADEADFERQVRHCLEADGPHLIGLKLDDQPPVSQTERDPAQIRDRFMRGMGAKRSKLPGSGGEGGMSNAYRVESVAEAFLVLMKARGIDHFFVNAGTDSASLVEAYARQPQSGLAFPQPVIATHENLAVGMAHGYTMVTGRPQAVMLHVSVGAANAVCALMNAARDNIPMLFTAGRTPLFEQGRRGARNVPIHWAQEMFDQAGMVREIVKWDYELRDGLNLEDIVDRAIAVSTAPPQAPVYLTLPREVLATEMRELVLGQEVLPVPTEPAPDPAAVERLVAMIEAAEFPVIATATAGRRPGDVAALAALAERGGIGVVETNARYMALPASHPLHLGVALPPLFGRADLIIVLEADVPWMPSLGGPRAATRIVHAGVDPLFARYPVRGYRSDLTLTTSVTTLLPVLGAALGRSAAAAARRERVAAAAARVREARAVQVAALRQSPRMTKDWMNLCLDEAKPADAVVVNEYWSNRAILQCEAPGSFYHHPPAAGLGWGLPAALGAKLAQRDRPVIATLGDGAYVFANPAACHQVAAACELPVLTILCNNARWQAVQNAAQTMYPEGHASRHATPVPLADLSPTPAFEKYSEASGGHGECVSDPKALPEAIRRGLRIVQEEGRQALLNVLCA